MPDFAGVGNFLHWQRLAKPGQGQFPQSGRCIPRAHVGQLRFPRQPAYNAGMCFLRTPGKVCLTLRLISGSSHEPNRTVD